MSVGGVNPDQSDLSRSLLECWVEVLAIVEIAFRG